MIFQHSGLIFYIYNMLIYHSQHYFLEGLPPSSIKSILISFLPQVNMRQTGTSTTNSCLVPINTFYKTLKSVKSIYIVYTLYSIIVNFLISFLQCVNWYKYNQFVLSAYKRILQNSQNSKVCTQSIFIVKVLTNFSPQVTMRQTGTSTTNSCLVPINTSYKTLKSLKYVYSLYSLSTFSQVFLPQLIGKHEANSYKYQ